MRMVSTLCSAHLAVCTKHASIVESSYSIPPIGVLLALHELYTSHVQNDLKSHSRMGLHLGQCLMCTKLYKHNSVQEYPSKIYMWCV